MQHLNQRVQLLATFFSYIYQRQNDKWDSCCSVSIHGLSAAIQKIRHWNTFRTFLIGIIFWDCLINRVILSGFRRVECVTWTCLIEKHNGSKSTPSLSAFQKYSFVRKWYILSALNITIPRLSTPSSSPFSLHCTLEDYLLWRITLNSFNI